MSSWYVLSSLGIYPIAPGNTNYQIGRPLFDQTSITLENGKQIVIITQNNSNQNKYVQSVKWNNNQIENFQINHNELIKGGVLVFEMGSNPVIKGKSENQFYTETIFGILEVFDSGEGSSLKEFVKGLGYEIMNSMADELGAELKIDTKSGTMVRLKFRLS
jgi:two-component sensor histidine kinase